MRQWFVPVILLVTFVLVMVWVLGNGSVFTGGQTGLLIKSASGEVSLQREDGQLADVVEGETRVKVNERLTTGESGRVVLSLGPDLEITVSEAADVKLGRVTDDGVQLELENGRLKADVRPGAPAFEVSNEGRRFKTNDGAFEILAADEALSLQVQRGEVQTSGVEGVEAVDEGKQLNVMSTGEVWQSGIPKEMLLNVDWPTAERTKNVEAVLVGRAEPGSKLRISGVRTPTEVRVGKDGRFEVPVELKEGLHAVEISAVSMWGKSKASKWNVELDTKGPLIRGEIEPVQ